MAANLDSIAGLCQDQHLCKTPGLLLRLPTYKGCRIAAGVPDITPRLKA